MTHKSEITPGAIFTHYKNKDYEIVTLAFDESTTDPVVVYRALYGEKQVWVRRLESFCETIAYEGRDVERFKLKI